MAALIPEILRRGFQDLLESVDEAFSEGVVSAAIEDTHHERCHEEPSTHHNDYRQRLLTTQVGDPQASGLIARKWPVDNPLALSLYMKTNKTKM